MWDKYVKCPEGNDKNSILKTGQNKVFLVKYVFCKLKQSCSYLHDK